MRKILTAGVVILCLGFLVLIFTFERTKIKTEGTYHIANLESSVNVYFDNFGIPHIQGNSSKDIQRVLGYVMASERLFQMELMRRVINGQLSEVLGKDFLDIDILSRKLRIKKTAQEYLAKDPEIVPNHIRADLNAYLEGIHSFIDNAPLPMDFRLAGFKPGRFDMADLLAVSSYMALGFSEGLSADILFAELMEKLPEEKMEILRKGANVDQLYKAPRPLPNQEEIPEALDDIQSTFLKIESLLPTFHGSNAWVLSGERTESGKPLLANDPHIGVKNPHVFYEAHISYPGFEVYGHFLPLSPFPVMGHTPYMAWGLTMAEVDDVTVYLEKINPEDPTQVMYKNEWVQLVQEEELISVKGEEPVKITVSRTPHGPLLTGTSLGVSGKALSLHWSVYHPENNVMRTLHDIPRSTSIDDLRQALSYAAAPGLNVMYANIEGDIAWWTMGKFPKLPEGVPYDLVLNGWDGTQEVERYYSIDENPHEINPKSGVIVSANYKPQDDVYAHFEGYWQPSGRFFKIKEELAKKEKWNVKDTMTLQTDTVVPFFEKFKQQLLPNLEKEELEPFQKMALEHIAKWNGDTDVENTGATIFYAWIYYISENVFLDELGEENFKKFGNSSDHWHALKALLKNQEHSFWDNVKTNRVESGQEIIVKSFKDACAYLTEKFGKNVPFWKWGRIHQSIYNHPIGSVWPLSLIYNIGPIPAEGGRFVINNLGPRRLSNDFKVVHGPATRRIVDFANLKKSFGILPTGNSGNPFSEYYSDQALIYSQSKYRSQIMDWSEIKKNKKLVFEPSHSK